MTALDTKLIPKVLAILERLGKSIVVHVVTVAGTYNSTTRLVSAGTVVATTVKAVPPTKFKSHLIDGTNVRITDMETAIAASGLTWTPTIGWKVVIDGFSYTIHNVETYYTGELPCLYWMHLR